MCDDKDLDGLKQLVLKACNMEDEVEIDELTYDEPLFGPTSTLGLDSLDAVEIVFLIQKTYGVRIETHAESREAMANLRTLMAYIRKKQADDAGDPDET